MKEKSLIQHVRDIGENRRPVTQLPDGADYIPISNADNSSDADHFQLKCTTDSEDLINFVHSNINEDLTLNDGAILSTTNSSIDTSKR